MTKGELTELMENEIKAMVKMVAKDRLDADQVDEICMVAARDIVSNVLSRAGADVAVRQLVQEAQHNR